MGPTHGVVPLCSVVDQEFGEYLLDPDDSGLMMNLKLAVETAVERICNDIDRWVQCP